MELPRLTVHEYRVHRGVDRGPQRVDVCLAHRPSNGGAIDHRPEGIVARDQDVGWPGEDADGNERSHDVEWRGGVYHWSALPECERSEVEVPAGRPGYRERMMVAARCDDSLSELR